ncbi:TrmH family RNA methyltransferase [Beduinella massiliensis]|uniref:TrmH family RNA methyltransferase n=1 Tax=Beduinella massiliensis TaxID=1852363 RepID=UPI000C8186D4
MQEITSTQNEKIRALKALSQKKGREEAGCFLVESVKMVREAADSMQVLTVLVDASHVDALMPLLDKLEGMGTQVLRAPEHVLKSVSDAKTPQGILASVRMPKAPQRLAGTRLVALDGVQDPGNVGTILRTADAAGFDGALLGDGCADVFGPKALRATMGSIFRVPVLRVPELPASLTAYREAGYSVVTSELDGSPFYQRKDVGERFVLVIGSEARGVSDAVSRVATHRLKLPMRGGAESLNAAVAAGIMLYELTRPADEGR